MATAGGGALLMDANVLIDLCDADRTLLRLVSAHVGPVHVPLPILMEEVATLAEADWSGLGLRPVEPTLTLASTPPAPWGDTDASPSP